MYDANLSIELPAELADIAAAKTCKTCSECKPTSDFYFTSGRPMSQCKECWKAKVKARVDLKPKALRYKITSEAEVTREMVEHYFIYDAVSGVFTRRISAGGKAISGLPAGTVNDGGYIVICMAGRDIRAHRLVWFMERGEFPTKELVIDHINRNPADNRISNLRAVPQKMNAHNITKPKKQNTTGFLGVRKFRDRFTARIYDTLGKEFQIGTFDTPEEASAAYWSTKNTMYPEAVIS